MTLCRLVSTDVLKERAASFFTAIQPRASFPIRLVILNDTTN